MKSVFTVVIPAFNEEKNIETVLQAIRCFLVDDFSVEIIVVDNGSTDTTSLIAKKYADKVFVLPDLTISELRNYGVRHASGDYIGFIDADCIPCKDWAVIAKQSLDVDSQVGIVGSFYSADIDSTWVERLWIEMRDFSKKYVNFLPAGNCSVKKKDFLRIGGFTSTLQTGEDYDLCLKFKNEGLTIRNIPSMLSQHRGNAKCLVDVFKGELWYGQTMLDAVLAGHISKPILACFSILSGFLLILISLFFPLGSNTNPFFLSAVGTFLFLGPVAAYASVATLRAENIIYFFPYCLIFTYYLAGRILSLYYAFSGKKKRTK